MEKKPTRPMTPFDELTMPSELQTLKLLLPYTPVSGQQSIWILIKFMELQYTMQIFRHPENLLHTQTFHHSPASPMDMLEEVSPYLAPGDAEMLSTLCNVLNIMEMMQTFQDSSDFSGEGSADHRENNYENTDSGRQNPPMHFGGMNPMDLMMGILSPEQQEMFQMYQNMFSNSDSDIAEAENTKTDILENKEEKSHE